MHWGNEEQKRMKTRFMLEQYGFVKAPKPIVPYLPDQLDVDISNRCNISCVTCFHSIAKFKPFPDMTMETFRLILDQAEGKSSTITFGNHGEPFVHKQALDMMQDVKDRGFFLNVIDNGTLLTEERAKAIIEIGVDRLSFSLDSVDPTVYPKLRRGAKLERTLHNILNFIRLNYEAGMKIYTNVSTVNSRLALTSKPDFREYFSRLPVHVIYTSDILNFHDMLELREETKFVQRGYENVTDPAEIPICVNGFDRLLIRPNGNLSLCPIDWDCVHILGNVHDAHYAELWNNEKAQEFRRALIARNYAPVEKDKVLCSKCDGKWVLDVTKRPGQILDTLTTDLQSSKELRTREVMTPERYENVREELRRVERGGFRA